MGKCISLMLLCLILFISCENNPGLHVEYKSDEAIDLKKIVGDKDYRPAGSFLYENDTIASHFFINQDSYLIALQLDSLSNNFKVQQVPELHSYKNAWYSGVGILYYNFSLHNNKLIKNIELFSDGLITKVSENDSISEHHIEYNTLTARFNNEKKARFYVNSEDEPSSAEIIFYKRKKGASYAFILISDNLREGKRELYNFLFQ